MGPTVLLWSGSERRKLVLEASACRNEMVGALSGYQFLFLSWNVSSYMLCEINVK